MARPRFQGDWRTYLSTLIGVVLGFIVSAHFFPYPDARPRLWLWKWYISLGLVALVMLWVIGEEIVDFVARIGPQTIARAFSSLLALRWSVHVWRADRLWNQMKVAIRKGAGATAVVKYMELRAIASAWPNEHSMRWIWMGAASEVAAQRQQDVIEILLADAASIGNDAHSSNAVLERAVRALHAVIAYISPCEADALERAARINDQLTRRMGGDASPPLS
jgi:hypothetical protein